VRWVERGKTENTSEMADGMIRRRTGRRCQYAGRSADCECAMDAITTTEAKFARLLSQIIPRHPSSMRSRLMSPKTCLTLYDRA
jgi:hypothetical protein